MTSIVLPESDMRVAHTATLDKLLAAADGDAALLYLYLLRHGNASDENSVRRALRFSPERYQRAQFTLTGLTMSSCAASQESAVPCYTPQELRSARQDDRGFSAICHSWEAVQGRMLTEAQLRCLYTAYDHLGLSAEALIEMLAYLKEEKGELRLSDLRKETYLWADMGLHSAVDAQKYLASRIDQKPLLDAMVQALGGDSASPSPKERRTCDFAFAHGFSPEAVALAAQRTFARCGKRSLDYLISILREWDKKNVHTVSEITALEPEGKGARIAVGQNVTTPSEQLADWEMQWLEELQEERRKMQEAES